MSKFCPLQDAGNDGVEISWRASLLHQNYLHFGAAKRGAISRIRASQVSLQMPPRLVARNDQTTAHSRRRRRRDIQYFAISGRKRPAVWLPANRA
jgi:hypothetical protein